MATFEPKEIKLNEINNGNRYNNGDTVSAESINAPIEASAYAQQVANQALDWVKGQGIPYHIGYIYMSTNSTSPAELFGGTWERIKDRFLLACGDNYSAGKTDGSATHTHSASGFAKICTSAAGFNMSQKDQTKSWSINYRMATPSNASQQTGTTSWGVDTDTTVNYSSNMPPYLAVYIWKRTA